MTVDEAVLHLRYSTWASRKLVEAVETIWPEIQRRWEAWALSQTDADLAKDVSYKLMDGSAGQSPAWQIVLHVVNHGTLHRGQVMAMLRQRGIAPPATDLIYYYRELRPAAAG